MSIDFFQTFKISVVEGLEKTEIFSDTNVILSLIKYVNWYFFIYVLRETEIQREWLQSTFVCTSCLHNRLQVPTTTSNSLDLLSYFRHPTDIRNQKMSKSSDIIWCFIMESHVFQIWRLLDNTYTSQATECFFYFPDPTFL